MDNAVIAPNITIYILHYIGIPYADISNTPPDYLLLTNSLRLVVILNTSIISLILLINPRYVIIFSSFIRLLASILFNII